MRQRAPVLYLLACGATLGGRRRWASFVLLVSGACLFVALALLAIPERIGADEPTSRTSGRAATSQPKARPTAQRTPTLLAPAQPAPAAPITMPTSAVVPDARLPHSVQGAEPELAINDEPASEPSPPMPTSIPIGPVSPEDD